MSDCKDCAADIARCCKGCTNDAIDDAIDDAIARTKPYERAEAWREVAADFQKRASKAYLDRREAEAKLFRDVADDALKKTEAAAAEGRTMKSRNKK